MCIKASCLCLTSRLQLLSSSRFPASIPDDVRSSSLQAYLFLSLSLSRSYFEGRTLEARPPSDLFLVEEGRKGNQWPEACTHSPSASMYGGKDGFSLLLTLMAKPVLPPHTRSHHENRLADSPTLHSRLVMKHLCSRVMALAFRADGEGVAMDQLYAEVQSSC